MQLEFRLSNTLPELRGNNSLLTNDCNGDRSDTMYIGHYESMLRQYRKVQVGKDQEKAQSEKDSNSKNRGGKKTN